MTVGLLLLWMFARAESRQCQSQAPTASLLEELRMCRELNFAFCIEAGEPLLEEARAEMADDLPADVLQAATSEVSAMAVVADRYLTRRYKALVEETEPSQTCLHHWRMAICSETFSVLGAPAPSLCHATCRAVAQHCTSQFITPGCEATLQYGDQTAGGGGCVDYATLVSDEMCVVGDANDSGPQQPPLSGAGVGLGFTSPTAGGAPTGGPVGAGNGDRPPDVVGSSSRGRLGAAAATLAAAAALCAAFK